MISEPSPDPILSASIYCADHLDEVIQFTLLPLWQALLQRSSECRPYLWFMRYNCRGEHLKIRVHSPKLERDKILRILAAGVERLFCAHLSTSRKEAQPRQTPPVDDEDHVSTFYPDGFLLWTTYRRSATCLSGGPLLKDDRYAALVTSCLGAGSGLALQLFESESGAIPSHGQRQSTLLRSVITALAHLCLAQDRISYLQYHRDWLLRFVLIERNADPARYSDVLGYLNSQALKDKKRLEDLRSAAQGTCNASNNLRHIDWFGSLNQLFTFLLPHRFDCTLQLDPFSKDNLFPILFKMLHMLANQLGIKAQDEAFTYHLLYRSLVLDEAQVA